MEFDCFVHEVEEELLHFFLFETEYRIDGMPNEIAKELIERDNHPLEAIRDGGRAKELVASRKTGFASEPIRRVVPCAIRVISGCP